MHDQRWHDLHASIEHMTSAEKRDLINELNRSLNGDRIRPARDPMTHEQKQAVLDLLHEVDDLPIADEPSDDLVASRDHDKILYDGTCKIGFPEKPFK